MTIYEKIKTAGIEHANHESDLYFPKNSITDAIVSEYPYKALITTFKDNATGARWYDVPFAYDPFWDAANR